ncbi:MAG: hypothetical protein ACXW0F_04155 [Gaiellaceae bacterium]
MERSPTHSGSSRRRLQHNRQRRTGTYWPGERDWLKIKNRDYWRCGQELERARSPRQVAGDHLNFGSYGFIFTALLNLGFALLRLVGCRAGWLVSRHVGVRLIGPVRWLLALHVSPP